MCKEKIVTTIRTYKYQLSILFLIVLLCIWFNPILFLKYIQVLRWPVLILLLVIMFKNEISKLVTDKTFSLKAFGLELQGNLVSQAQSSIKTDALTDQKYQKQIDQLVESHKIITGTNEDLKKQLTTKELELQFEQIYNLIFGTQFALLEYLTNNNGCISYDSIISQFLNNNFSFNDDFFAKFLGFLVNYNLIELDSYKQIKITDKGRVFVYYIRRIRHYIINKPF